MLSARCASCQEATVFVTCAQAHECIHFIFLTLCLTSLCKSAQGLQIWDRRRRIPSSLYKDPLAKLFEQFDADHDGSLTAEEITTALNSRGVEISTDDVKEFIRMADKNNNEQIEKAEFEPFVFALANAEMLEGR